MNQIYIRGNEVATKAYVDSLSLGGDGSALSNYYTKEEINNLISNESNSQATVMPEASANNVNTIIQYIGETNENYTQGYFYICTEETVMVDGVSTTIYKWEQIQVQDSGNSENIDLSNYYTKEEINNVIAEINNTIQKETMPDPSEDNKGTIVQYVGVTNNNYTTGYFYQVVEETVINEDGTETIIYKWEQVDMPSVDLSDYATKKYVDDMVAGATGTDLSNYYTKEEINNKGYITSSEANSTYVTQSSFNTLEKTVEDKANSSDVYTKEETDKAITDAVADVKTTDFQTATELPTENISTNTIYLISKEGVEGDVYEEYIYINNKWEKIGETTIDLSQYSTTEEMNAAIAAEIAKIDMSKYLTSTEASNTFATKTEVSNINNSINNMYSKTEVNTAIETAINNITHPEVDLSNYYNKQEIDDIIGDINAILDAINGEEV